MNERRQTTWPDVVVLVALLLTVLGVIAMIVYH